MDRDIFKHKLESEANVRFRDMESKDFFEILEIIKT